MKNIHFEIYTYAPELNTVYLNGVNINRMFADSTRTALCKDFKYNLRLIRKSLKPLRMHRFKLVVEKPSGTIETRFCFQPSIKNVVDQYRKAKQWYNIEGTNIKMIPLR